MLDPKNGSNDVNRCRLACSSPSLHLSLFSKSRMGPPPPPMPLQHLPSDTLHRIPLLRTTSSQVQSLSPRPSVMVRTGSADTSQPTPILNLPPNLLASNDPAAQRSALKNFFSSSKSNLKPIPNGHPSEILNSLNSEDDSLEFRCCSAVAWDIKCVSLLSGSQDSGIGIPTSVLIGLWKEFEGEMEAELLARVPDSMDADYQRQKLATEQFWNAQKRAAERNHLQKVPTITSSPISSDAEAGSGYSSGGKQKKRPSPLNLQAQPTPPRPQLISPLRQHSPLDISVPLGVRSPPVEPLPPLPGSAALSTDATPRATSNHRFDSLHSRNRSQSSSRQGSSSPIPYSSPTPSPTVSTFADRDRGRARVGGQVPRTHPSSNLAPGPQSHIRTGSGGNLKDTTSDGSSPTSNEFSRAPDLKARRSLGNLSQERQRQSGAPRQKENVPPVPSMPMEGSSGFSNRETSGGASVSRSPALSRPSISNMRRPSAPNLRAANSLAASINSSEDTLMPLRPGMLLHSESYDHSSRAPQSTGMGRTMSEDNKGAGHSRGVFAPPQNVAMARNMSDQSNGMVRGSRGNGNGRTDSSYTSSDRSSTRSSVSSSQRRHQHQPSQSSETSEHPSQRSSSRAQAHSHSSSVSSSNSTATRTRNEMSSMASGSSPHYSTHSQSNQGEYRDLSPQFNSAMSGRSSIASLVSDSSSTLESPTLKSPAELFPMLPRVHGESRMPWDSRDHQVKKITEDDENSSSLSPLHLELYGPSGDQSPAPGERALLGYLNTSSSDDHTARPISPTINFTPRAGRTSRTEREESSNDHRSESERRTPSKKTQRASNNSENSSKPLQESPEEIAPSPTTRRSRAFSFGKSSKPRAATVSSGSAAAYNTLRSSIASNASSSKESATAALGILLSQGEKGNPQDNRDSISSTSTSNSTSTSSSNSNSFNFSFETSGTEHSNHTSNNSNQSHSSPVKKRPSYYRRGSNANTNSNHFPYEEQMNEMNGEEGETSPTNRFMGMLNRKSRKESFGSSQRTLTFGEQAS